MIRMFDSQMSDNWIIVFPQEPGFVPSPEARQKAVELFQRIATDADEVKEETTEGVRFIDCGANCQRVLCPHCGAEIEIEWWHNRMNEEADTGFPLKLIALPCCGEQKSIAELDYDWPQGFARFSVEAMNPGIPDLSIEQMRSFEAVLGCPVRKVLQHI